MILQADLMGLLASPNESLTIEYKSWLPLSEKQSCAALAKAAIALANQGGGLVVLGMRENKAEESTIRSQPRPESVGIYRQDDVNAAINRYADPPLHCELLFAKHPETAIEHAFILSSPYQDVGEGHPASETAASRSRVAAISLARLLNGS